MKDTTLQLFKSENFEVTEIMNKFNTSLNSVSGLLSEFNSLSIDIKILSDARNSSMLNIQHIEKVNAGLNSFISKAFGDSEKDLILDAGLLSSMVPEAGLESLFEKAKVVAKKVLDFIFKIYQNLTNYIAQAIAGIITSSKSLAEDISAFEKEVQDKKLKLNIKKFMEFIADKEIPLWALLDGVDSGEKVSIDIRDYLKYQLLIATDPKYAYSIKIEQDGSSGEPKFQIVRAKDETAEEAFKKLVKHSDIFSDKDYKKFHDAKVESKTVEIMQGKKLVAISTNLTKEKINGKDEISLSLDVENFALGAPKETKVDEKLNTEILGIIYILTVNVDKMNSGAVKKGYLEKIKDKKDSMEKIINDAYKKIDKNSTDAEEKDNWMYFNDINRYVNLAWKIYPEIYLKNIYALNSANRNIFAALKHAAVEE